MSRLRKRIAQVFAAGAAGATFLPWQTTTDIAGTVSGTGTNEGRLVLVGCLITVGLIQLGWRPAWIGAGFSAAVAVRQIFNLSGNDSTDPRLGLWLTLLACTVAAALLVWDLFAGVTRAAQDGTPPDQDKPGGQGLSGPLGRRR